MDIITHGRALPTPTLFLLLTSIVEEACGVVEELVIFPSFFFFFFFFFFPFSFLIREFYCKRFCLVGIIC